MDPLVLRVKMGEPVGLDERVDLEALERTELPVQMVAPDDVEDMDDLDLTENLVSYCLVTVVTTGVTTGVTMVTVYYYRSPSIN